MPPLSLTVKFNKLKKDYFYSASLDARTSELVITSTFSPWSALIAAKIAIIVDFPSPVAIWAIIP